ncbi:MAG: CBS domain-containing protein, partial [Rhodospirillales bacterium]|nr:CBS domain-containing protein [Rhodospirillales bacterium]
MTFIKSPDNVSGMPLVSAPIIILDTETTGLDVSTDRIIEIGAVRISGGAVGSDDKFVSLVNPTIPIPARATEIHGISDRDVADAANFTEAINDFTQWAGPALIIGYSIGYDLAIMQAEYARHDMEWYSPRCLDVRHLVQIFAPNLPKESLEITAEWLGIEVTNRHRALDDAIITANVFIALLPKLKERGINTLAQAERACRSRATQHEEEAKNGWHEVAGMSGNKSAGVSEYARIDSYPYRHKVSHIMHAPPLFAGRDEPLHKTLSRMTNEKVSSLFLPPDSTGAYGIITERDVLRAIDTDGANALDKPASTYAIRPLVTVGSDEFVYRAISSMADKGFRHLGVADDAGEIVGALSARDLLKQRASDAILLGDNIEAASTSAELGTVWSELITVVKGLVYEEVDPRDIAAVISRELRALTRRACELAERHMIEAGEGEPPVPYAMLVLGSGGRGESLLAMDQDNAIVYASGDAGGPEDQWFEKLGSRVADTLNDAGVDYCKGGIMARNAAWRKNLNAWIDTVEQWVTHADPQDILSSDIFYDAKTVYGDWDLANRLREKSFTLASGSTNFIKFHTLKAADFRVPLGLFNRFKL